MRTATRCVRRLGPIGVLVALSCDVPAPSAPAVEPGLVVFGVLDPAAVEQVVLLTRSRTAKPDTTPRPFVADDPIVSSGETPVTGATVVLYGASGDSAVAVEDRVRRADRLGAGVYRLWTSGNQATAPAGAFVSVVAGGRYRLRVGSPVGNAEGTTTVPATDRVVNGPTRNVSLVRDTVLLTNGTVTASGGYVYSLRAANGTTSEGDPQFRRDLERRLVLPSGGDDWAFAYARERLRTGTRHVLTVTAADTNYFEYFGSQSDPFADRTGRTTLRGATGVFGSVFVVYSVPITVTLGS